MVFSFVEFLRVCFSTQNWTRILTSLDTESYDWLKKMLDSYWKISISISWHWKGFIEKLQFFSFLLIIILLHFRKVPILLTQLDCHVHFSVSLLDFFVYLIRLCQCCTSAERFNKKKFFVDWNCLYFFSQDLDQQLYAFGEPLALEVSKFVLCVCSLTLRTCNSVPIFLTERSFLGSFNRTIDYNFFIKASIKESFALVKVSSIWDSSCLFSMFESWHFKKSEVLPLT